MASVAIAMPAKDEEEGLRQLALEFKESALSKNPKISIMIVLDNRSSDKSWEVSKTFATTVLDQTDGHGKGMAVRSAIETWSKQPTDYFVMMDADGSYQWEDVSGLIDVLQSGVRVVTGVRLRGIFNRVEGMSFLHHIGNHALALAASIRNRRRILDLCSGLWGFERDALLRLSPTSDGFDLEAELHGRIRAEGIHLEQMPIKWRQRVGGEAKIRPFLDGLKILWRIIKT